MTGGWRTWVIVLGMIVVASASYSLARYWQDRDSHYRRLAPVANCDLHAGPCRAALADGEVELSISPRAIPLMTPLQIAPTPAGYTSHLAFRTRAPADQSQANMPNAASG